MPFQKLQFKPGVNRESTSLANEGTWYESDKVRFRSGYPEKIGGWELDDGVLNEALKPPTGLFWGVCRSLWNWITVSGLNLLGIGTNSKYYIEEGVSGIVYDVTPLRITTTAGDTTFAATTGSAIITATETAHGAIAGAFVTFSGATSLGGTITADILNAEHRILSATDNTYTFEVSVAANSSDTGDGGASVVAAYQLNPGPETTTTATGWGAGGWGGVTYGSANTGWGQSASEETADLARLWSAINYDERLLINPRYGAIYMWVPSGTPGLYNRAVQLASTSTGIYETDVDCPSECIQVMVAYGSKIVIAFGCNDLQISGGAFNPLLIRWSDQESPDSSGYNIWTPAVTNQAGGYTLSHGSEIQTALQTRQEIVVFTDAAVYSMQFVGPPYVWQFTLLSDNISIIGPNTAISVNNVVYWMGVEKFYRYTGRVETLPCTLRQYIYGDINQQQSAQFFVGTNEGFNEIWWFYCSANSNSVDRYVIYNHLEDTWAYGTLGRTAWLDSALREVPVAATTGNQIVYHEVGCDDGTTNPPTPIEAYVQSADFNIADGHHYGFASQILPDITFDNSTAATPEATFTLKPRQNPGAAYSAADSGAVVSGNNYLAQRNYTVQRFTEIVYIRIRGRQMAMRVSSNGLGTAWQLGVPAIDVKIDGRRA